MRTNNSKQQNQRLSAVRKMAAKKGGQVQFQIDVTTEEEWSKLLEKKGLIVVDVYSEWCGPCSAMVSSLKKLKLEIGSDYLHFAVVKSDFINCLKRFRNKSEPTWMLIAGGHLVNLMFGVNAPRLSDLIRTELNTELKVLNNEQDRVCIPFDQLTEEEKQRVISINAKEEEKRRIEDAKLVEKMKLIRRRSLEKLSKMMKNYSCILYFPHTIAVDGTCSVASKMMFIYDSASLVVVDQMSVQLSESNIEQMFYNCNIYESEFGKNLINSMKIKPVLVTLVQTVISESDDSSSTDCNLKKKKKKSASSVVGLIERVLCTIVYGEANPVSYTNNSAAYEFLVEDDEGEKFPPIWTPTNSISKAAALEILFPRKVEDVGYKPEQLPPPQIVIIYDSNKVLEIIELLKQFGSYVLNVGYFDSIDPNNARLLCKKYSELKKLSDDEIKNAKMVVTLKKEQTDEILLEFSQVIPVFISADEKMGTEEAELFFPYDYISEEVEQQEEDDQEAEEEGGKDGNEEGKGDKDEEPPDEKADMEDNEETILEEETSAATSEDKTRENYLYNNENGDIEIQNGNVPDD